jgi:hypothetical protein
MVRGFFPEAADPARESAAGLPKTFSVAEPGVERRVRRARWTTGLYGGLAAGVVFLLFVFIVRGALFHDTTLAEWFAFLASAFLGTRAQASNFWAVAFGLGLHFLGSAGFGILYALVTRLFPSMLHSPGSLVWGLGYGLCVWLVLANMVVPTLGMTDTQPLWEALVGSAVFYGWPISESVAFLAQRGL